MAKLSSENISELLLQAEQRLGGIGMAVSSSDCTSDRIEPVPPTSVSIPREREAAVRSALGGNSKRQTTKHSAGSDWFDLPKTVLTSQFKRDWQVLRMRSLLDPKRQKKTLRAEAPKYSQVGRIIEGPTDFFSARLARKDRQQTILAEVMREHSSEKLKAKYASIQKRKSSGKKAFYQKLVAQRRKGRG